MEIFLCDKCDTLATLSVVGDTIKVQKCYCVSLFDTPEAE
jgi:hypothetical protein